MKLIPWTERERKLLAEDLAELKQAMVAFESARRRLLRMGEALRPDAQLDVERGGWVEDEEANGTDENE